MYENVEVNMENIAEHPLHINKTDDGDKSNVISEDLADIKEKRTVSLKNGRSGVSGDQTVMTEKACDGEEEIDDPQNKYRVSVNEKCLESYVPDYRTEVSSSSANQSFSNTSKRNDEDSLLTQLPGNEVCSIAPGEGKHPVHFMQDKHCQELAFPVLFPLGRLGYQVERAVKLSPTKYFNARLLNYTRKFAANPEYLFFAQYITEQKKVQDSINIALKKCLGRD